MSAERASGMHRIVSDVADLAILQLQLVAVEGREASRRGIVAVFYLGIATALLIAAATVGMMGCGWLLHELAGWPVGWSLLAMAGFALLMILVILALAYASLKKAAGAMAEVGTELAQNLEWLRAVAGAPATARSPYPGEAYPVDRYPGDADEDFYGHVKSATTR